MHIEVTQQVNAPTGLVFDAWTDFANAPAMIGGIEKVEMLTDGDVGVGTRFAETRRMFGKEATETFELTGFEPGRSYTLVCDSCGSRYVCTLCLSSNEGGTLVKLTIDTKAVTVFAKLMSPLGVLMAGSMQKVMRQDMVDAAAFCEAKAARSNG
ncbi:MAG: SRPBCC family protein [Planctomycetota bacterium]